MPIDVLLEPDQSPHVLAALAQQCEAVGVRAMWLQNYVSSRDAFMSLVPAAQSTSRIILGVCLVSPWEMHPLKLANCLLSLNDYSRGRAAVVVGGGGEWPTRIGIEPKRMVTGVRETVEIVKSGLSSSPIMYEGELFKALGVRLGCGPAGAPPVVYVGANRDLMLARAGCVGDGIMFSDIPRGLIEETVGKARQSMRRVGRQDSSYRVSNVWAWHIKASMAEAMHEARRELILRALLHRWRTVSFLSEEEYNVVDENRHAFFEAYRGRSGRIDGVPEAIVRKLIGNLTLTGTPETLREKVEELRFFLTAGVDDVCLRLHDAPDKAIDLIGRYVVPAFG